MRIQISLSVIFLGLFFMACGGSSSQKEKESGDNQSTPAESNVSGAASRESVAARLSGMWYVDRYFSVIDEYKSLKKANNNVYDVISAGFMEGGLMGDSPKVHGGSVHEGGFSADILWDHEENLFRSKPGGHNSMAEEPFKIELVSDSVMKFVFESNQPDRLYRKINYKENELEKIINDLLFTGTYKLPGGETVTFTSDGKILGYDGHSEMRYEVARDLFDHQMDVLSVSTADRSQQDFHYVIDEKGFTLFDIYGDDPGSFEKGDSVNRFVKIDGTPRTQADGASFKDAKIETAYFDLPAEYENDLKDILDTENLSVLGANSLEEMKYYLDRTVLAGNSPFGPTLSSNYFWFVYNALPDFVSADERHSGYHEGQNDQSMQEKLMAYAIYRLDRSPENIEQLYKYARPFVKMMLPVPRGDRKGIHSKLQQLMGSYQFITEIEDFKQKLSDAYASADTMTGEFIETSEGREFQKFHGAYGFTVYDLNEHIMSHLKPGQDRFHSIPVGLSFWMRRNHEGNMAVVHSILKEIEDMM